MSKHDVVSKEQWIEARRTLLAAEKAWTRERDRLAEKRRALPWVKVEKNYVFEGVDGPVALGDLFDGRSQLLVYHFMFGPEWEEGARLLAALGSGRRRGSISEAQRCQLRRDLARSIQLHIAADGWTFRWVSSAASDFNYDITLLPEGTLTGVFYNFENSRTESMSSRGQRLLQGRPRAIYHTCSTYGRGGEMFLPVYGWLDVVPKGRNETKNGNLMDWVRRHDRYEDDGRTRPATPASAKHPETNGLGVDDTLAVRRAATRGDRSRRKMENRDDQMSAFRWVPPFAQAWYATSASGGRSRSRYSYQEILIGPEDQATDAYRALQPFGQVPAIGTGELSCSSRTIVLHVAGRSGADASDVNGRAQGVDVRGEFGRTSGRVASSTSSMPARRRRRAPADGGGRCGRLRAEDRLDDRDYLEPVRRGIC
jgi:predicted dithiol-disulfide oxidoreductase (DUF899 family)